MHGNAHVEGATSSGFTRSAKSDTGVTAVTAHPAPELAETDYSDGQLQ